MPIPEYLVYSFETLAKFEFSCAVPQTKNYFLRKVYIYIISLLKTNSPPTFLETTHLLSYADIEIKLSYQLIVFLLDAFQLEMNRNSSC